MRNVNPKKKLHIVNKTNWFVPGKSRTRIYVTSPDTYQFRQSKIEGYETRLYWQYRYCEDHQGQTFFYTLTYNDKSMPHKYGVNCFDYEDLRDLLTGGFRKKLLRQYGTTFKYFVGAELGDGKGERGMHNNPHYHILFFLEPANNDKYPYRMIDPVDFRHLVRMYWQGFDQDKDGRRPFELAKYGIAKEGEKLGKVYDFRAVQYVAKYVTKDVNLVNMESTIVSKFNYKYSKKYKYSEDSYKDFFKYIVNPYFNIPSSSNPFDYTMTEDELVDYLLPGKNDYFPGIYQTFIPSIIEKYDLRKEYDTYVDDYISLQVKEKVNEWRNRYCNKCRISHGVGDYAIKDINPMDPSIQVPSKRGFKNRPISMYYYRKVYCDVVKDKLTHTNLYVLNEKGIAFKVSQLGSSIKKLADRSGSTLQHIVENQDLFDKIRRSDINTSMTYTYDMFKSFYGLHKYNIQNILNKYAEYKLVYEDRFFKVQCDGHTGNYTFPDIHPIDDYKYFISSDVNVGCRNSVVVSGFLQNTPEGYLPYYQHPTFLQYIGFFNLLDTISDYFSVQEDNKRQKEAEDIAAIRRYHKQRELKSYYSSFVG